MKKILIITPYCPYPAHKSGGIHALLNIVMENIKFQNQIDLIYYDEKDVESELALKKYFNKITYIDLRKKEKNLRIKSIANKVPYGIFQYSEDSLTINDKYDKVIFDQPLSMKLVDRVNCEEKILMAYDSMSLYFKRKAQINKKNMISNLYNILQSKLYKKIQEKQYLKFNKIIFVSENDALYERSQFPFVKSIIDYINLGVDYEKFKNTNINCNKEKVIVFTGIMSYAPNKDAAKYFAQSIFPEILKINKEVKFVIVGKDPDKEILELANSNIIVTGFVDDIVQYINKATVYVSPLRYGTGMKNKILEAMSCEKAIVASPISIEGISYLSINKNIYVPNNKEEWINKVNILLNNTQLNRKFGKECRRIIETNFSWENAYKKILD